MSKSKSFKINPAMSFISPESIEKVEGSQTENISYRQTAPATESKTKRVQLLIQPSLHSEAKGVAEELGISFNDFAHRAIREATFNDYIFDLIKKDIEEGR